jgi:sigma-B regulation protein RsbU (phosphoserine phosphatase)
MDEPSDPDRWNEEREKIIGLGERSLRKTYYPELQQKLDELERFRALLDQSNDCIFLLYIPSLTFVDVNDSACRQLDCPRQDILSLSFEKLVPKRTIARINSLVKAGDAQGPDRDTIITRLRKCSGEEIPVEITIRLVTFNKERYGVAVARDITERLQAEQVMLDNSRMLRDMELARQIQLSLLPATPPEVPGVLLAGCCVPAAHVGGDYYDYYRREDGVVDMVVADVSGHNIGAALMMVEARSAIRAVIRTSSGTGEMLASLNDSLYEDLNRSGLFITLFYLAYDPVARDLRYSNAGHVLPLLVREGVTACTELDAEGLILGVRRGEVFEERRIWMQPGDLLLVYTDGVTESSNSSGEMFGRERLCGILGALHRESPQTIVDALLREIAAFAGTMAREDDITMIVMKIL